MRRHAEKKGGEIMTTDMEATIIAQAAELERMRAALEYIMYGYGLNPPEF